MIWRRLKSIKQLTPEEEEKRREELKDIKLGWKDYLAMAISALLTLFLPAALFLGGFCLLMLWLIGAL